MLTVAVRLPDTVGLNATEMLQFAPAGTLFPQGLVCVKSPELVQTNPCGNSVPAGVGLREIPGVGAGHSDAGDGKSCASAVGEGDGLAGTGTTHPPLLVRVTDWLALVLPTA